MRDSRFSRAIEALVPFLTWTVSVWRGAAGPQWRADLGELRDQGLCAVSLGGSVSTFLTQLVSLVPLGPRAERAGAGSAFAAAAASWLLYRLARRALFAQDRGGPERLISLLAAVAATSASLGPSWQAEATVGGGAAVAVALCLAMLDLCAELSRGAALTPQATRRWLSLAVVGAAIAAESPSVGLVAAGLSSLLLVAGNRAPPARLARPMLGIFGATLLVFAAPIALRPDAPRSFAALAKLASPSGAAAPAAAGWNAAVALVADFGVLPLGLAALGIAAGLWRRRTRAIGATLLSLPLLQLLLPRSAWIDGARAGLSLLAAAGLSAAAALGVAETCVFLRRLDLPMARLASVLAVVFYMTVAALNSEEAGWSADRHGWSSAEAWTDQALVLLPERAALVVSSPFIAWRLWAAQRVEAQRPDVLLIAAPLLRRSDAFARLSAADPSAAPLLGDLALRGSGGEYALSLLADAHPLEVELDPSWDARLLEHVALDGAWLRYEPQALGAGDRPAEVNNALYVAGRIAASAGLGSRRDPAGSEVAARALKEQASALSLTGAAGAALPLVDLVERLSPGDAFALTARLRLDHAVQSGHRGAVELRDLLEF